MMTPLADCKQSSAGQRNWDRQPCDSSIMPTPAEIVAQSRANLMARDDDMLLRELVAASVDVVLKAHRRSTAKLEALPAREREDAIASWGAKHAWRHCSQPSIARLADVIAEFDRRDQEDASEQEPQEEIEVAPFDVELVGAEGVSFTVSERGEL